MKKIFLIIITFLLINSFVKNEIIDNDKIIIEKVKNFINIIKILLNETSNENSQKFKIPPPTCSKTNKPEIFDENLKRLISLKYFNERELNQIENHGNCPGIEKIISTLPNNNTFQEGFNEIKNFTQRVIINQFCNGSFLESYGYPGVSGNYKPLIHYHSKMKISNKNCKLDANKQCFIYNTFSSIYELKTEINFHGNESKTNCSLLDVERRRNPKNNCSIEQEFIFSCNQTDHCTISTKNNEDEVSIKEFYESPQDECMYEKHHDSLKIAISYPRVLFFLIDIQIDNNLYESFIHIKNLLKTYPSSYYFYFLLVNLNS
jgi:hypothetical protein